MEPVYALGSGREYTDQNSSCQDFLRQDNSTCNITELQVEWRDAISIVRIIFSALSIAGSLSIIITVCLTRTVKKETIQPLFFLSVSDLILSLLFVLGGALWLGRVPLNAILCVVALNQQVIYATLAYLYLKRTTTGLISHQRRKNERPLLSCHTVATSYVLAWTIPTILACLPFVVLSVKYTQIYKSTTSCWCLPTFMNAIPYTINFDKVRDIEYISLVHLTTAFGMALLVFIIMLVLVWIYLLTWLFVRRQRTEFDRNGRQELQSFITEEDKGFRRIITFMTYFLTLGIIFFVASLVEVDVALGHMVDPCGKSDQNEFSMTTKILLLLHAVVVPSQGAVNAIIFGWLRPSFRSLVRSKKNPSHMPTPQYLTELSQFNYTPTNSFSDTHYTAL